jgi:hypothetical protein
MVKLVSGIGLRYRATYIYEKLMTKLNAYLVTGLSCGERFLQLLSAYLLYGAVGPVFRHSSEISNFSHGPATRLGRQQLL